MTQQDTELGHQAKPATKPVKSRVKAEFRYPVYDLADSITVARTIREQGGGAATADRLAGFLKYGGTRNGAFISRIAAARMFGLIMTEANGYVPTKRAMRILAPERPGIDDGAAMVEAFKDVPLYGVIATRYHGQPLPPEVGLRNAMETQYGIPRDRTAPAYRVLIESARLAGYFDARDGQPTHLVEPPIGVPRTLPLAPRPDADEDPGPNHFDAQPAASALQQSPAEPPNPEVSIFRRVQETLVEKMKELPADDLDKLREYIKEIKEIQELEVKKDND